MRTILVTGSNGLLGQKLVNQLKANSEFKLVATSRGSNRISNQDGYIYQSLDLQIRKKFRLLLISTNQM